MVNCGWYKAICLFKDNAWKYHTPLKRDVCSQRKVNWLPHAQYLIISNITPV